MTNGRQLLVTYSSTKPSGFALSVALREVSFDLESGMKVPL